MCKHVWLIHTLKTRSGIQHTVLVCHTEDNPTCAYYTPYDGQLGMSLVDVL